VKKLVRKAIERKAVGVLKDEGYTSACRGLCGRRMRKVARKVRTQRKKFEKQVRGLKKFKSTIVKKQIKKIGIPKHKISRKEYKSKVTILNAKFAQGLITRTEWLMYTTQLRSWVVISRKTYKVSVLKLKTALSEKKVSTEVFKVKLRHLKQRKVTRTRYTWK
jgi:hypothetical protein